jgi:hypothetical protein
MDGLSRGQDFFEIRMLNMTLTELLCAVRQLSLSEKLKLIRLLIEDLGKVEDISPLEPFKTYNLPTPYNSLGAGAALMKSLN